MRSYLNNNVGISFERTGRGRYRLKANGHDIYFTAELPKTRSGKIMRRLLRDIAEGRAIGDTTTLADANVVRSLKDQYEDKEG